MPLLLENKIALIHGAGGAVGGAVSRAFAREGATVFLNQELRPRPGRDRSGEVVAAYVGQWDPLNRADADGVQDDVDAARLAYDLCDVSLHGVLVERVDAR